MEQILLFLKKQFKIVDSSVVKQNQRLDSSHFGVSKYIVDAYHNHIYIPLQYIASNALYHLCPGEDIV